MIINNFIILFSLRIVKPSWIHFTLIHIYTFYLPTFYSFKGMRLLRCELPGLFIGHDPLISKWAQISKDKPKISSWILSSGIYLPLHFHNSLLSNQVWLQSNASSSSWPLPLSLWGIPSLKDSWMCPTIKITNTTINDLQSGTKLVDTLV